MIAPNILPKYTQISRRRAAPELVEGCAVSRTLRENIVQKSARSFAERLNKCLDDIEAPAASRERAAILSKMLDIPKHHAWGLVEGHQPPDQALLEKIANEFDVDPHWLAGEK